LKVANLPAKADQYSINDAPEFCMTPALSIESNVMASKASSSAVLINLLALRNNFRAVRSRLSAGSGILGIVKANAYGHGAVSVSRILIQEGTYGLGVHRLEEALELREAGIGATIVILGGITEEQAEISTCHDFQPVVYSQPVAAALSRAASKFGVAARIHIKVDTGMGRLGVNSEQATNFTLRMLSQPGLSVESLLTHFADSDGDIEFTHTQLSRFRSIIVELQKMGMQIPMLHACNSGAILRFGDAGLNLVRPGILLYGYSPSPSLNSELSLEPVLTWLTWTVQINLHKPGETIGYERSFTVNRPSRIAVLPVGYSQGVNRRLSNLGSVLVKGQLAPIVGKVCMDMLMADVSHIPGVKVGDEAVIIGCQGDRSINAQDIADLVGTIPYEVLCSINARIPRIDVLGHLVDSGSRQMWRTASGRIAREPGPNSRSGPQRRVTPPRCNCGG
jgi:alanine racemase